MKEQNMIETDKILQELQKVRWHVAEKTYGNDHATLIGLLVDWWISLSPKTHTALEGGPSNGYSRKGMRGQCDALLCDSGLPAGVLEVEGSRCFYTAKKIGYFFAARYPELKSLQFGILVLYAYEPVGIGKDRQFPLSEYEETLQEIQSVTKNYRDKTVIVISIDKQYVRQNSGIRAQNEYYFGEPSKIQGYLFCNGRRSEPNVFWKRAG
jgi:hypothetical protein